MAENDALGGSRQEMVDRFTHIPGLGRSRAEAIYDAGYTNFGLVRKASVEELTKIPGIGISLARCLINSIDLVKEDAQGAIPAPAKTPASAALAASEQAKIMVGEPAPADGKKPETPSPAATGPSPAQPGQPRGFLSSIFDRILGKPSPAQSAPDNKEPGPEPEKKAPDKPEGVTVEAAPAEKEGAGAKPEQIKEADKPGAAAGPPRPGATPPEPKPAEERPVPARDDRSGATLAETVPNVIKVDAKPDDKPHDKM